MVRIWTTLVVEQQTRKFLQLYICTLSNILPSKSWDFYCFPFNYVILSSFELDWSLVRSLVPTKTNICCAMGLTKNYCRTHEYDAWGHSQKWQKSNMYIQLYVWYMWFEIRIHVYTWILIFYTLSFYSWVMVKHNLL